MKYLLIGYMASGKSTIGKTLAEQMKVKFYDLDSYIESEIGQNISEIFDTKGEIYFRKLEHLKLKELINLKESMVLSLGGGTPCYAGNMSLIRNNGISVYLQYPLEKIVERLWNDISNRPLVSHIKTKIDLEDFVRKHLFERSIFYQQAHIKVNLNNENIEQATEKIRSLLQTSNS